MVLKGLVSPPDGWASTWNIRTLNPSSCVRRSLLWFLPMSLRKALSSATQDHGFLRSCSLTLHRVSRRPPEGADFGTWFRVIAVCTSVRPNKLTERTSESLLQSSKQVFRTTIIHVPLPTSVNANPKVPTNETSPSHSSNIGPNHPKAYTVAPAITAIKSTALTKESKRAHDEDIPTSSETGWSKTVFLRLAKATSRTSRSLAHSHTRMNFVIRLGPVGTGFCCCAHFGLMLAVLRARHLRVVNGCNRCCLRMWGNQVLFGRRDGWWALQLCFPSLGFCG